MEVAQAAAVMPVGATQAAEVMPVGATRAAAVMPVEATQAAAVIPVEATQVAQTEAPQVSWGLAKASVPVVVVVVAWSVA